MHIHRRKARDGWAKLRVFHYSKVVEVLWKKLRRTTNKKTYVPWEKRDRDMPRTLRWFLGEVRVFLCMNWIIMLRRVVCVMGACFLRWECKANSEVWCRRYSNVFCRDIKLGARYFHCRKAVRRNFDRCVDVCVDMCVRV